MNAYSSDLHERIARVDGECTGLQRTLAVRFYISTRCIRVMRFTEPVKDFVNEKKIHTSWSAMLAEHEEKGYEKAARLRGLSHFVSVLNFYSCLESNVNEIRTYPHT